MADVKITNNGTTTVIKNVKLPPHVTAPIIEAGSQAFEALTANDEVDMLQATLKAETTDRFIPDVSNFPKLIQARARTGTEYTTTKTTPRKFRYERNEKDEIRGVWLNPPATVEASSPPEQKPPTEYIESNTTTQYFSGTGNDGVLKWEHTDKSEEQTKPALYFSKDLSEERKTEGLRAAAYDLGIKYGFFSEKAQEFAKDFMADARDNADDKLKNLNELYGKRPIGFGVVIPEDSPLHPYAETKKPEVEKSPEVKPEEVKFEATKLPKNIQDALGVDSEPIAQALTDVLQAADKKVKEAQAEVDRLSGLYKPEMKPGELLKLVDEDKQAQEALKATKASWDKARMDVADAIYDPKKLEGLTGGEYKAPERVINAMDKVRDELDPSLLDQGLTGIQKWGGAFLGAVNTLSTTATNIKGLVEAFTKSGDSLMQQHAQQVAASQDKFNERGDKKRDDRGKRLADAFDKVAQRMDQKTQARNPNGAPGSSIGTAGTQPGGPQSPSLLARAKDSPQAQAERQQGQLQEEVAARRDRARRDRDRDVV